MSERLCCPEYELSRRFSRRVFVRGGGLALVSWGFAPRFVGRAFGATAPAGGRRKVLVCVFQRGAVDGLNMVIPYGDNRYYDARPNIAVPAPRRGDGRAIELDGFFALHPALEPLRPWYRRGHLAIIHAVGSPDATRSHFDAQDYMESGTPGIKSTEDGWLNRLLAETADAERAGGAAALVRGMAMTDQQPRALAGRQPALAVGDLDLFLGGPAAAAARAARDDNAGQRDGTAGGQNDSMSDDAMGGATSTGARGVDSNAPDATDTEEAGATQGRRGLRRGGWRAGDRDALLSGFEALYGSGSEDLVLSAGSDALDAVAFLRSADPLRYEPANGAEYPRGELGQQLRQVAQLIKADVGLEIAFTDVGGWDTHAAQGGAQGQLANRLRDFGGALAAFARDLGDRMEDVVVLTMSEFGRTVEENGNGGTDHGHANACMVLGGGVEGGRVYGRWPGLAPEQRFEGRDLAITTDFRDLFAEVADGHLQPRDVGALFPGYRIDRGRYLDLLKA